MRVKTGRDFHSGWGITGMDLVQVVRAALPWLKVLLLFLVIVTYVPQISLVLPHLMFD